MNSYKVIDADYKANHPSQFKLCWEYSPLQGISTIELSRTAELCERTDFVQSGVASMALAQQWIQRAREEKG